MLLEIFQTIIIEPAQGVIPALMIAGVAMQGVNAAFAMGSANAMNSNIESLLVLHCSVLPVLSRYLRSV